MNKFVTDIVEAIVSVTGKIDVGLHEPDFIGNEWNYVKSCIDSKNVSSTGDFVEKFEEDLSDYTGAKNVVAVVNGTSALHVAIKIAGVLPGDEVLVPALTFVATANAVSFCGGIPHFIDSEIKTLGVDPDKLREYLSRKTIQSNGKCINKESLRTISALIPMHTFGHPARIEELKKVADDFNLVLIEDAAESLGSFYKHQHTGTFGTIGILSFNGNKIITTGGGGAILTNDKDLAKRARKMVTTAKIPHRWEYNHDEVAFNFRMPNINAALGCAQLETLNDKIRRKRVLFEIYKRQFADISGVSIFQEPDGSTSNYWLNCLILESPSERIRNQILELTNEMGIQTRPAWNLMNRLPMYKNFPKMNLSISSNLLKSIINIPSSASLVKS